MQAGLKALKFLKQMTRLLPFEAVRIKEKECAENLYSLA